MLFPSELCFPFFFCLILSHFRPQMNPQILRITLLSLFVKFSYKLFLPVFFFDSTVIKFAAALYMCLHDY